MKKKRLQECPYTVILFAVFILLVVALAVASPFFFTWKNCMNVLNQSAIYMVLAIGMTLVISAGQIDLSVGSIIGFTGMTMGMMILKGVPTFASIIIGLLVATGIGALNGVMVAYGKINSFIVTLSTMTIMRGIILILTNSSSVFGFGTDFAFWGSGSIGSINIPIIVSFVVIISGAILLHKTRFGNYCLFLGSNEIALNRSGINVKKYKIIVFSICGLCAGIAGLIVTARLNSAEPLAGQGYEMDAIAATILGGTSMQGGKGNITGTVIACFILNILKNGLTLLSISSHYQEILMGVVLLISVLISESRQRKKSEV